MGDPRRAARGGTWTVLVGGVLMLASLGLPWYRSNALLSIFGTLDEPALPATPWAILPYASGALALLGTSSIAIAVLALRGRKMRQAWFGVLLLVALCLLALVSPIAAASPEPLRVHASDLIPAYGMVLAYFGWALVGFGALARVASAEDLG